jgi:hypothetical protein
MANYINKFKKLRSKCAVTGVGYKAIIEILVLVKSLNIKY